MKDRNQDISFNPFGVGNNEEILSNINVSTSDLNDEEDLYKKGLIYFNGNFETQFNLKKAQECFKKAFEAGNTEAGFKLLSYELYGDDSLDRKINNSIFSKLEKILKEQDNNIELANLYRYYDSSRIKGFLQSENKWIKYWEKANKNNEPIFKTLYEYGIHELEIKDFNTKVYKNIEFYMYKQDKDAYKAFFDFFADDKLSYDVIIDRLEEAQKLFSDESWVYLLKFKFVADNFEYFNYDKDCKLNETEFANKYRNTTINVAIEDLEKAIQIDDNIDAHFFLYYIYNWAYNMNYDLSKGSITDENLDSYLKIANEHIYKTVLISACYFKYLDLSYLNTNQIDELIRKYSIAYNNFRKASDIEKCLELLNSECRDEMTKVQLDLIKNSKDNRYVRNPIFVGKIHCGKCFSFYGYDEIKKGYFYNKYCFGHSGDRLKRISKKEIETKFIDAMNIVIKNKDEIIKETKDKIASLNESPIDEEIKLRMSKFIADLTKLDSKIYEWSDELWLLMVNYVIVFDDKLKFVFYGGNEIEIN